MVSSLGEKMMTDVYGNKVRIYIFAMVLSASHMKFVCCGDKPFTATTFVEAHALVSAVVRLRLSTTKTG